MKAKITSIKCQYVLSDAEFKYINDRIGEWLPVLSLNYDHDGSMWGISIRVPEDSSCISLFMHGNDVEYELHE